MSSLDAEMRPNYSMTLGHVRLLCAGLLMFALPACGDRGNAGDSARGTLPPVFPQAPSSNTNWDVDAGPVMLVSIGNSTDSAAVILPEITDNTIASVQGNAAPVTGLVFDLFGRGGKIGSSTAVSAPGFVDTTQECDAWPVAAVRGGNAGWRVGFARGHTEPIRLDSIDVVIADIVRSVNEEANPRLEHLLLIGERPVGVTGRYTVGYYSRTAGAEETTQASEVLAAVRIGPSRRPALVMNIEYDDGRKLGLIERTAPGQWRSIWRSAYTDC